MSANRPPVDPGRATIRAAVIGALVALIVGVLAAGVPLWLKYQDAKAQNAAAQAKLACPTKLQFVQPPERVPVNGAKGVVVKLKACNFVLNRDFGWLFDYDPNIKRMFLDTQVPLLSDNGTSTFNDMPVGNKGDENELYQIYAVLCNQAGNSAILGGADANDDDGWTGPPKGCSVVDTRNILVTWPDKKK